MKAQLVCDALTMAIWQRRPASNLIVHTDRGSQYASHQYRQLLVKKGFIGSMSSKGNCWDTELIMVNTDGCRLTHAGIGLVPLR